MSVQSLANNSRPLIRTRINCGYTGLDGTCNFTCTLYRNLAIHSELTHNCEWCGRSFLLLSTHTPHCTQKGRGQKRFILGTLAAASIHPYTEAKFSLRGSILIYTAPIEEAAECSIAKAFEILYTPTRSLLQEAINFFRGVKVSFRVLVHMIELKYKVEREDDVVGSPFMPLTHVHFFDSVLLNSCNFIINSINLYLRNSSDWQIVRLKELQCHLGEYAPIRGRGYVATPPELSKRRGLISVKAVTNCFRYSLLCSVYGDDILRAGQAKRRKLGYVDKKECEVVKAVLENPMSYIDFLHWINLDFLGHDEGVSLAEIDLVEEHIPSISISVYGHVGQDTVVLRAAKERRQYQVNLLLIKHPEQDLYHYICIKDFSIFQGKMNKKRHDYCPLCQQSFLRKSNSIKHHRCGTNSTAILPPKRPTVKFNSYNALLFAPFILYYRFYYLRIMAVDPSISTHSVEQKVPFAYTIILVESKGKWDRFAYQGEDCVEHFFNTLLDVGKNKIRAVNLTNNFNKPTEVSLRRYHDAKHCEVCGISFSNEKHRLKQYHHHHWTGEALQVVCTLCNLLIKPKNMIAAFTLSRNKHEFKFMLQRHRPKNFTIDPIRRKDGEYIGLNFRGEALVDDFNMHFSVRLVDVENFRSNASLGQLAGEMSGSDLGFRIFKKMFGKDANPNTYLLEDERDEDFLNDFNSVSDFIENRPAKFVANVISNDAQRTARGSNVDIVRHICNAETAILADIFEEIRSSLFLEYRLDISQFWSISSFSKEAALLWEKVELESVFCPKISALITKGTFGGVISTTKLKSIANSSGNSNYDPSVPPKEILYADISMSYTSCLLGNLPSSQIHLLSETELECIEIEKIDLNGEFGYLFCVDIDYKSDDVKDFIGEFPFPPERRCMKLDAMSAEQCSKSLERGKKFIECERVLLTLFRKFEQVYYFKFLIWMLNHGVRVIKKHYGVKFKMAKLFSSFAQHNVDTRNSAKCELVRQLKKSLCNNLVGKLQAVSSDYNNAKFLKTSVEAVEAISKHNFQSFDVIDENCSLFEFKKESSRDTNLKLIALAVMSDAKQRLYELYWDHLKMKFEHHLSHCYSHTDSLIVEVTLPREQVLKGLKELNTIFDFSNLPVDHPLYDMTQKGKPGVLKLQGDHYLEYYSVGTAQYSLLTDSSFQNEFNGTIRASGIPKSNIAKLRHSDYKKIVEEKKLSEQIKISRIKLTNDAMIMIETSRRGLGNVNFSRFFISNTESLAFGDRRTENYSS